MSYAASKQILYASVVPEFLEVGNLHIHQPIRRAANHLFSLAAVGAGFLGIFSEMAWVLLGLKRLWSQL